MKILQFVTYSANTNYLRDLGNGLKKRGAEVIFGTLFTDSTINTENGRLKDSYFSLNVKTKKDFPSAILRLVSKLRQQRPDIIQTHLYEASFVGLIAAKMAGVPIKVLTRHHLDQAHMIGRMPVAVDKFEARIADRIVVLSNAVKEFMVSIEGVNADRINVIHQGFDFGRFSAAEEDRKRVREEFSFSENDFVIGTFGNFFPTKGHRFLVSSVADLLADIPNLKLFFVGKGGDEAAIQEQIAELGIGERVIFTGFRNDVASCMKAVDTVVHPSLSEAFCQVLIETMSVGTPLISTNVGGAQEVIEDGKNGLLIPAGDVNAITSTLKTIYTNREFANQIAAAGQRSVRERFTIEMMIDKQFKLYQELLGN